MLQGVASRHRRVIYELRPYRAGKPLDEPLALLRAVSDRDKHRVRHETLVYLEDYGVTVHGLESVGGFPAYGVYGAKPVD